MALACGCRKPSMSSHVIQHINQLEVIKTLAVSGQCIQRHTHASHISPGRLTTPPLIQLLFHQPLCAQVNPSLLGPLPLSVMDFL